MSWSWIAITAAQAIHDRQLAEHGGADGIRDPASLESALARPRNLAAYGKTDKADLAAAYAFGIARNHPFVDGNKRTAWVIARLFLAANNFTLTFERDEAIRTMLGLAAGDVDERALADWFRERIA
jgi:death-on-curing protein